MEDDLVPATCLGAAMDEEGLEEGWAAAIVRGGATEEEGEEVEGEEEEEAAARWCVRLDDDDGGTGAYRTLDKQRTSEGLHEAMYAYSGMLRRALAEADEELCMVDGKESRRKPSAKRLEWLEALNECGSVVEYKEVMAALQGRMVEVRGREMECVSTTATPQAIVAERTRLMKACKEWKGRLVCSMTFGELALRLVELEAILLSKGGVRGGMVVQVEGGQLVKDKAKGGGGGGGGKERWVDGYVVGCFRDGSFRVRVEEYEKKSTRPSHPAAFSAKHIATHSPTHSPPLSLTPSVLAHPLHTNRYGRPR